MLDYAIDFGAGEAVLDITLHLKASGGGPPPPPGTKKKKNE